MPKRGFKHEKKMESFDHVDMTHPYRPDDYIIISDDSKVYPIPAVICLF